MLEGLRTVVYSVPDIEQAKGWYSALLGQPPYFDQPFYVGFNVGGYELGLLPGDEGGATTYWGVPDADAAYAKLLEQGATAQKPVADVGEGIRLGTVRDPSGNTLGIITNPNFQLPQEEPEYVEAAYGFNEDSPRVRVTSAVDLPPEMYEAVQSGARSAGVSLKKYMGSCFIFGLEKGWH